MACNELFKHTKYIKQIKSERTGVWSFKVFIPYETSKGKQTFTETFSSSKYQSNREAFNAAVFCRDQFLVELKTTGVPNKSDYTALDILEKSFEMSSLSAETQRKKRVTYCKWIASSVQLSKISNLIASDVQLSMAEAARKEGISQGILDDLYCIWNQIFKTALRMELIYRNPMDMVDKLKITKKYRTRRVAETDLDTLLHVCEAMVRRTKDEPRLKYDANIMVYALKVSWFTALRPAEVLALEYQHVDYRKKVLYVRQEVGSDTERKAYIRDTKTFKSRRNIPLNDEALRLFAEIEKYQKHKKYLFADYEGNLMTSTKTADKILRVCNAEDIEFNWYCLRHQYSTDMQRNKEDLSVTAKGMGHENINMTYQYTRMSDDDLRLAMDRLGRTLSKENI